jgi:hypothetical protein
MILLRVVAQGEYGTGEGLRRVRGRLERNCPPPLKSGTEALKPFGYDPFDRSPSATTAKSAFRSSVRPGRTTKRVI